MKLISKTEKLGYLALLILFIASLYIGFTDEKYFDAVFAAEDGMVEWLTTIMLFLVSMVCLSRLFKFWGVKKPLWKLGTLLFMLIFFFGAGEEISWGQRIFGIESGEFFKENNAQKETNLHNLVVGETKVNKLVFSQLLVLVMVLYLVVSPILYRKATWFKNLANQFAVPIVKWHHTAVFVLASILVALLPPDRKWEVYELVFGLMFLLIFLGPLNHETFSLKEQA